MEDTKISLAPTNSLPEDTYRVFIYLLIEDASKYLSVEFELAYIIVSIFSLIAVSVVILYFDLLTSVGQIIFRPFRKYIPELLIVIFELLFIPFEFMFYILYNCYIPLFGNFIISCGFFLIFLIIMCSRYLYLSTYSTLIIFRIALLLSYIVFTFFRLISTKIKNNFPNGFYIRTRPN